MSRIMLFAEFDVVMLIPFAVFAAIAAGAWFLLDMVAANKTRSEERLDELSNPTRGKGREGRPNTAGDKMTRMLEKATPALAKPFTPKKEKDRIKLQDKLSYAGLRHESAVTMFLGLKFVLTMLGLFVGGGIALLSSELDRNTIIKAVAITGVSFYFADAVVLYLASRRKQKIFLGLPDALDLLVVCVEAGLGFDQAMRKVAEEMKKSHKVIAYEFALCNMQFQMGRTRSEVLHELGTRNGVDDLKALAAIIIQSDKFGSSIAQALRVQSDSMRTRRKQLAEEKAAKTAVKLIFPLVLFIFPGIFVILVGPAAITVINEMLPVMAK
jgi:tight adherence protein C